MSMGMGNGKEMDVARRAKIIEWLKTEMIEEMAQLYRGLWEGRQARIVDGLASLIVSSYLLARRLGVSYRELDDTVVEKLKTHKRDNHQLEEWYGDLSSLERHLDGR
ncbi:MazG-like family protein [Paenibacillus sp. TRM 82003]|nr:MazG-like family protein [Paenibacillus sp. TRM 82003]